MTDTTLQPAPVNAATIVAWCAGLALAIAGLAIMLPPSLDSYGLTRESVDLVRILVGASVLTSGGTMLAVALLLTGLGHLSARHR